jgi:hypothetical protein
MARLTSVFRPYSMDFACKQLRLNSLQRLNTNRNHGKVAWPCGRTIRSGSTYRREGARRGRRKEEERRAFGSASELALFLYRPGWQTHALT